MHQSIVFVSLVSASETSSRMCEKEMAPSVWDEADIGKLIRRRIHNRIETKGERTGGGAASGSCACSQNERARVCLIDEAHSGFPHLRCRD